MDLEKAIELTESVMERMAKAFERIATVMEKRYEKDFPPQREKRAAEINYPGKEKEEQLADKPTAEWIAETEQSIPKTRFQERFEKQERKSAGKVSEGE